MTKITIDRELLELAAKAAGFVYADAQSWDDNAGWNPLTDDGDALRLAVKLGLHVQITEKAVFTQANPDSLLSFSSVSEMEMFNGDPYAATRRAIVRAAAEIGRGMK